MRLLSATVYPFRAAQQQEAEGNIVAIYRTQQLSITAMSKTAIVIGAGLGGLECGILLSRAGYRVTVLEQNATPGGCIAGYWRDGAYYDTGFHYAGSIASGQTLDVLLRGFGLGELPWQPLEGEEVLVRGRRFFLPFGFDAYEDTLSKAFPHCRAELHRYMDFLREVAQMPLDHFGEGRAMDLFARSAYEYLEATISDPLLREVLCAASTRLPYAPELPLYSFAQINASFIQSAARLEGGGETLVKALVRALEAEGGILRCYSAVQALEAENGRVCRAVLADGSRLEADLFVSDIHPALTCALLSPQALRPAYRKRIASLRQTEGFTGYSLRFHSGAFPYPKRNYFLPPAGLFFAVPPEGKSALTADILVPGSRPGEAQRWIAAFDAMLPGLAAAVEQVSVSTPQTWERYLGMPQGSAYGIAKDYMHPLSTVLSARTPLDNLFLTGQNLNLHGVLGVSMTALYTCAEMLGTQWIKKQFGI